MTMSDDLVKRLRKVEPDAPGERTRWYRNPDGPEAADRIEQLEAALLEIFDHECRTSSKSFIACTAREALWTNAALGEKKDG